MVNSKIVVHTDGGSRGNPGPAACGFLIEKDGNEIYKGAKYLGKVTNNFAEYSGVISALEWLLKEKGVMVGVDGITFILDSELVVRQLTGVYRIKDQTLQRLAMEVKNLITKIAVKIDFKNVLRNENKEADRLLNEELDRHSAADVL